MDGSTIGSVEAMKNFKVEKLDVESKPREDNLANEMKDIRKARLQRKVFQDPSLANKLVATENSPVYNTKGTVIQALSTMGIDV